MTLDNLLPAPKLPDPRKRAKSFIQPVVPPELQEAAGGLLECLPGHPEADLTDDLAVLEVAVASIPPPKAHLTVVEMLYRSSPTEQPVVVETKFTRPLLTNEQTFIRHLQLGEEWVEVETGWLERASMLVITNLTKKTPTKESVIELGVAPETSKRDMHSPPALSVIPILIILPGEGQRLSVLDIKSLRLRCVKGACRCTLHVFSI